jgi:predicted RNase H-like HicB family nuclease
MKYPVFIEKDEKSDYGVTVPDLPGCFSAGSTLEDAFENAEEAILTHIEGLLMDNEKIPSSRRIEDLKRKYAGKQLIWGIVAVDIGKLSKETKRINITIPENILSKIDTFARKEGESRSGFLASAAIEYISQHSLQE